MAMPACNLVLPERVGLALRARSLLFNQIPFLIVVAGCHLEFLRFADEKLVGGFVATRPRRVVVFVEKNDAGWIEPGIKKLQPFAVRFVQVYIEVDKAEPYVWGKSLERLVEVAGDEGDIVDAEAANFGFDLLQ